MSFLEYAYKIALEPFTQRSNGVKHKHEQSFIEVARKELTTATTCDDARRAVREIVANLIGCEELALYEIDYGKAVMWPRWSYGVDPESCRPVDLIAFPELNRSLQGQATFFPTPTTLDCFPVPVLALAPVVCDDGAGLLVLFSLLPQKPAFNETDKRLLEVISLHGGRALNPGTACHQPVQPIGAR